MGPIAQIVLSLLLLFSPDTLAHAGDLYRTTRSREVQQAISQIGQAEYYARMALRSLEASETTGRAPFFDYKKARQDLERIAKEMRSYLGGEGSPARVSAVPIVIDGRYFAESIKEYVLKRKGASTDSASKVSSGNIEKTVAERSAGEGDLLGKPEQRGNVVLSPPASHLSETEGGKRDKIAEILKKGL